MEDGGIIRVCARADDRADRHDHKGEGGGTASLASVLPLCLSECEAAPEVLLAEKTSINMHARTHTAHWRTDTGTGDDDACMR